MKVWFKKCPYCWKEIKDLAVKCQYCLKFLDQEPEKTTKECPFCLNEIDINEKKCPFCDERFDVKNKKELKDVQEKKWFLWKMVSNVRKKKWLRVFTYIFWILTLLLVCVSLWILINWIAKSWIFVIWYVLVLLWLFVFIFYKRKFFNVCFFLLPIFIVLLILFLYFFIPLIPSFISDYKYERCDVDCFIKRWFESYEKWDDFNAKQYFDDAFLKRKYWKDQRNLSNQEVIQLVGAIVDIYKRSWFEKVSDWSYSWSLSTEIYFDTISYWNYLIDIIWNSINNDELQQQCYTLLFSLCDTVMEVDYWSSRRIYFNMLDSLSWSISESNRLNIYKWIILSDAYWIGEPSTSENDVKLYYSEIETSASYALLIQDDIAWLYYYKWSAEYNLGKFDDVILDLEKYLSIWDNFTWSLIDAYIKLWMSYFVKWRNAEISCHIYCDDAFWYFEKAENTFKKLVDIQKNNDIYRYLWAMCVKKINNTIDYTIGDYEVCCNYWKDWMSLWLDSHWKIYDEYSKYCKKIDRYTFQHIDF